MGERGEKEGTPDMSLDGGIDLDEDELHDLSDKFIIPIKSRITKVGSSSAIIIPNKVLRHQGFNQGDFVDVILRPREPTDDELKKYTKKKKSKKR